MTIEELAAQVQALQSYVNTLSFGNDSNTIATIRHDVDQLARDVSTLSRDKGASANDIRVAAKAEAEAAQKTAVAKAQRIILPAVAELVKEERAATAQRIDSTVAQAQVSVELARSLTKQQLEVAEALLTNAAYRYAHEEVPQVLTATEGAIQAAFKKLDSIANTLALPNVEPHDKSVGGLLCALVKATVTPAVDPQAKLDTAAFNLKRAVEQADTRLSELHSQGDALASIPGHLARGEALDAGLDSTITHAVTLLHVASKAGTYNANPIVAKMDDILMGALSRTTEFRGKMVPRWGSAANTAIHGASSRAFERIARGATSAVERIEWSAKADEAKRQHEAARSAHREAFPKSH